MGKRGSTTMATRKSDGGQETEIALIRQEMKYIRKDFQVCFRDIKEAQEKSATKSDMEEIRDIIETLVTKDKFEPVQKIVYAMVTLILTAFIGALIALVFKKGLI